MRGATLLVLALASVGDALRLAVAPLRAPAVSRVSTRSTPVTMQFGKKKTVEEKLEEKGYWPGEWVCVDCGYIYEPGTVPPFEELRQRWKCPQCAGPRRRFAKKAGGMTASIDDSPLIYGTIAFAVLTAALVYFGLTI